MLAAVPAGLDGNSNPISSPERTVILRIVADAVAAAGSGGSRVLVAVDGASGTGKSTFADELGRFLVADDHVAVRASVDSFHRPREERYRLGKDSPVGFYRDSHDLAGLRTHLLDPFAIGAASVRPALFDEPSDRLLGDTAQLVPAAANLVMDGLFLHRSELVDFWDLSVYLVAEARREADWQQYLTSSLPQDPAERNAEIAARVKRSRRQRYVEGQALYERDARPFEHASIIINNDDFARPYVIRPPSPTPPGAQ